MSLAATFVPAKKEHPATTETPTNAASRTLADGDWEPTDRL